MSPKSRGRPPGRGRSAKTHRQQGLARPLSPADQVLREAHTLSHAAPRLLVESTASGWLGRAWVEAPVEVREPQRGLIDTLADRLTQRQGPQAALALAALRTVGAPADRAYVDDRLTDVPAEQLSWAGDVEWTPRRAWRRADVYDAERVLLVEFHGPQPHDLLVRILTTGGLMVDDIVLSEPGAIERWRVAKPDVGLAEHDVTAALTELADALRTTDVYWPRQSAPDYVRLRALAHARSRAYLEKWPDWQPAPEVERQGLIDAFVAEAALELPEESVRLLADLFIDFGEGYLVAGPLAWNPGEVGRFLLDWVPRKAVLDAEDRVLLPAVLRAWVAFALRRRGLDEEDIEPVVSVVDELEEEFGEAYDDESAWGPGKQVMAALLQRGVDVNDQQAVEHAVRAYNAEQLARRLVEGD